MSVSSLVYEAAQKVANGADVPIEDLLVWCATSILPREISETILARHRIEWSPEENPNPFANEKRRETLLALLLDLLVMAKLASEPLTDVPAIVRELCTRLDLDLTKAEQEIRHIQDQKPAVRVGQKPQARAKHDVA